MTGVAELRMGSGAVSGEGVPAPRRRWLLRVGLPALVLGGAAALLAWAARDSLRAAIGVEVAPVVAKAVTDGTGGAGAGARRVVAQAAGWIEPAPYAVTVPALEDGVVAEVLALEGERVEKGQVLARLIDADARLALARAVAGVRGAEAEVERAGAAAEAAGARVESMRAELARRAPLVEVGAASEAAVRRLELDVRALEGERGAADAASRVAERQVERGRVEVEAAELRLARMEIRAPVGGVVLSRSVEPGTRIAPAGPGPGEAHDAGVFRLYDPARLQVRVDVPLADAGKVREGTLAEVTTEAIADRTFEGRVTRVSHEADIQRNTVQAKVSIEAPDAGLKPEMLARVRFIVEGDGGGPSAGASAGGVRLLVPAEAIRERAGERGLVWVVDLSRRGGPVAAEREVVLGGEAGELVEVVEGLREGDRVIVGAPAGLEAGRRVRVAGEAGR